MKTFTTIVNGYNKSEVNDFVSEVIVEYEKLLNKLKSKDIEISNLKDRLNDYKNIEHGLNNAIIAAEDSANDIRAAAKEEAKLIIEDAKKNASIIVNDSLINASKTNKEAEELRNRINNYKIQIKKTIEDQLVTLEDIDKVDF